MSTALCLKARQFPFKSMCRCYSNIGEYATPTFRQRIFSGIQPTGIPHLGNYLGALQRWVQLQKEFDDVIFSVVDLHSISVPQDPATLRSNILDMVACLLAVGINPEKSILFQQSTVHEHAELSWILGCLTTLPRLEHLPQWKEKSDKVKESGLGLFTYPVLQSADILLYKATHVPVGDDQVKHIELTRHLAGRFNKRFGTCFPKPKALVGTYPRIRSLRSPTSKMSKSESDTRGRLDLTDTDEQLREKLRKAVTDGTSEITYEPEVRPGVANLVELRSALIGVSPAEVVAAAGAQDTLAFKTELGELLVQRLSPIREEILRLRADPGYLTQVLDSGRDRATAIAQENLAEVKQRIGIAVR